MERQTIVDKIESLNRQKRINESQMLHIFWILSQEEGVPITRSQTRRLIRLERYSDETILKLKEFLIEIEKNSYPLKNQKEGSVYPKATAHPSLLSSLSLKEQEMKRRKIVALKSQLSSATATNKLP